MSFFFLVSLTDSQWVLNLWVYDFTLYPFLWEKKMPFESKLTGFKFLTYQFCFKDLCIYLFIWEEFYIYVTLFSLSLPFFFFLGGGLSLWTNLWDIVILQLCLIHLLVPSGNWLALNIICGWIGGNGVCLVLLFDL